MNKDRLSYQNDQINVTEAFCGSLGQNLFLSMGYVSVIFLLLELAAVLVIKEMWCYFIWVGIPACFFLRYYLDVMQNYEKALKLNPNNELAKQLLDKFVEGMKQTTAQ